MAGSQQQRCDGEFGRVENCCFAILRPDSLSRVLYTDATGIQLMELGLCLPGARHTCQHQRRFHLPTRECEVAAMCTAIGPL